MYHTSLLLISLILHISYALETNDNSSSISSLNVINQHDRRRCKNVILNKQQRQQHVSIFGNFDRRPYEQQHHDYDHFRHEQIRMLWNIFPWNDNIMNIINDTIIDTNIFTTNMNNTTNDTDITTTATNETITTTAFQTIRIDCGSSTAYLDKNKRWWQNDTYYVNGTSVQRPLNFTYFYSNSSTTQDYKISQQFPNIYYNYRRSTSLYTNMSYIIPVPMKNYYTIVLHFMELLYTKPRQRIFDIYIDQKLIPQGYNVDIIGATKYPFIPYIIRRRTYTSSGNITISLYPKTKGGATLSGIEIIQIDAVRPTIQPVMAPSPVTITSPQSTPTKLYGGITGFKLIYVPNNTEIMILNNNTIVNALQFPQASFSVRAINVGNAVSSVKFIQNNHFEGTEPFSYCGDYGWISNEKIYNACPEFIASTKKITITVSSFSGPFASGIAYPNRTVSFRIVNGTNSNVPAPSMIPVPIVSPTTAVFYPLLINVGGGTYTDLSGRQWLADTSFIGGITYIKTYSISETEDDTLYISERYGSFSYIFDIPIENYDVILHFAENYVNNTSERIFHIEINDRLVFENVDILILTGGNKYQAVTLKSTEVISSGELRINFIKGMTSNPKLCGIEVLRVAPHLAHAVTNGPYSAVDTDGDGYANVTVDASPSHTHGVGLQLIQWIWKFNGTVIGSGESTTLRLPVGEQVVTLFVLDNDGNDSSETTIISIKSYEFPSLTSITPKQGLITGGETITISGTGLNHSTTDMILYFGIYNFTGSNIQVKNSTAITFISPSTIVATPIQVFVQTQYGRSNIIYFTYIDGDPITFKSIKLMEIYAPTTVAFGPDENLYIGTVNGYLHRVKLDINYKVIETISSSIIADIQGSRNRSILGIAFDPMETGVNPSVYVSHSLTFHGETNSSSGLAINGKISRISGENLDVLEDIITGLPVSDHDHSVNGIEFGDEGELYIQIGSSTNAGVVGALSASHVQKDNVLSGATLVAYLSDPNFNGFLTYDADDDGNLNPGYGVEIFAYGNRNPYDIVLHSNGNLYGTDNGADLNFGVRSIGCGYGEELPEIAQDDKISLLRNGSYYGHANRKRGIVDPKQCVWYNNTAPSDINYTAPIVTASSSMDGIIEFQTDHFNGQLRGNLIYSKYKKEMYRVILNEDGTGVIPQSDPPIFLIGNYGLDVTQGPDGRLVEARYILNTITTHLPIERNTTDMIVKGVFPRRGGTAGGSNLNIYGINFIVSNNNTSSSSFYVNVTVGTSICPVQYVSIKKIVCTLPGGIGTVNITVSSIDGKQISIFQRGYRYISGVPITTTSTTR